MAGSFFGADVDQLRQLSRSLAQNAEQIQAITSRLSPRVDSTRWHGPDADRFRGEWNEHLVAGLNAAARALGDASGLAEGNARQQEQASGASASTASAAGNTSASPTSPESGPVISKSFVWDVTRDAVNTHIPGTEWSYGQIGGFIPGADKVLEVRDLADSFQNGEIPVHQMVDIGAGALRSSGNPLAYGTGVAIGTWNTVINLGQKADFPNTWDTNMSFIASNPIGALQGAAEGIVKGLPEIVKNFKFW